MKHRNIDKDIMGFFSSLFFSIKSKAKKNHLLNTKSFFNFVFITLTFPFLTSCDNFLNFTETDAQEKDDILRYFDNVKSMLNGVYVYLPTDYSSIDGTAMRTSATDDAIHVYSASSVHNFGDGSWSPINVVDNVWGRMYTGIRAANAFLEEGTNMTFENIMYTETYKQLMEQYKYFPYEAKVLRAYYYFELIKRYGDVPLVTKSLTSEEANTIEETPIDSIVKFIVNECDTAAKYLPAKFSLVYNKEVGRISKGTALALKSRALLYAASPLFNKTNDNQKWINAALAAKELISTLQSTYYPLPTYNKVVNDITSKEMIFEIKTSESNTFELNNTAVGIWGGKTGTCPTQNLVDCYEMKTTGLGINEPGSGYNPADPYANRDPRLDMTVLRHGSIWQTNTTLDMSEGGLHSLSTPNASLTGYYLKKYLIESISLNPASMGKARHAWIVFRYAEILLNYAEAMNEAYGPEVAGPAPLDNLTALAAVNLVRSRSGVAMPNFPTGMSKDAFREKLRNERRVEFAFEDHRFWDLRRWKIGPTTKVIKGITITKNPVNNALIYTPKVVQTRLWDDKMYLYPIYQNELYNNKKLTQNTGW